MTITGRRFNDHASNSTAKPFDKSSSTLFLASLHWLGHQAGDPIKETEAKFLEVIS